ncbi:MAG TPA: BamA/TamA family outer membrane protein [Terriglobales bacterium]|nr:BamA/TamA family outer membrane protein [Terriglobales bacterium]
MPPLIFLLSLLLPVSAGALTVDELADNDVYTVRSVKVEGVGYLLARSLRGSMLSTPPPWYTPWRRWLDPPRFNPEILRSDLDRIRTRLRESGYYEAQLTHELTLEKDQLDILVLVEQGPASIVREVRLNATDFDLGSDADALRRLIPIAAENVFTQKDYDNSRKQIERFYLERGYAYVSVEKAAVVDTASESVVVTYTVTRRQLAVFGAVAIEGLQDVHERLVQREVNWQAGDPYDPRLIEETQANLFGLELFRSVTVAPANLEEGSGVVDIAIHLAEGPQRSIRVGIGYGLEDQARGQLQWQHNNFWGGGRRLGSRLKASMIEQSVEGEFRQPYFLHPDQTFVLPLTQGRQDEPGFTVLWTRLAPRIERQFFPHLRASVGYNIEYDKLTKVSDDTQMRLAGFRDKGIVSSITASIERNTATNLLDPQDGSVLSLAVEVAGGPLQGNFSFYRGVAEAKRYFPIFGTRVIATRLRLGAGDGYGHSEDLPVFRRFFSGGISSVRGYGRYKLGPLTDSNNPIGGRSLIEAAIELRTPVWGDLGAVAFFDAGAVDLKPFRYDVGELQYAVGPGIRYATPVGPIRFDVGFPLNQPSGLPGWQIHFSIGQAF